MADAVEQLPYWVQMAWAIAGMTMAAAGVLWILCVVWPYMRVTRKVMEESLTLGRKSSEKLDEAAEQLRELKEDIEPMIKDASEVIHKIRGTSDDISSVLNGEKVKRFKGEAERFIYGKLDDLITLMSSDKGDSE